MSTLFYAPASSQEAPGSIDTETGWYVLAADVQALADAQYQELMGVSGKGAHKPPRADIAKLKAIYDLWMNMQTPTQQGLMQESRREWNEKYQLTDHERSLVENYLKLIEQGMSPDRAFEQQTYAMARGGGGFVGHEEEAKRFLGQALRKYEDQNAPSLYLTIDDALSDMYRRSSESYKLWPWLVKQIKDGYKNHLLHFGAPSAFLNPIDALPWSNYRHMVDVVTEAGSAINQLRQENKLPQNFDVNQMSFRELEDWFMQWKRENQASQSQGQVVYTFHDGWTMQKLTTPEQLQFEGDEMGHCVSGYSRQVEDGETIIYSLRDPKGEPHVTMEIDAIHHTGPHGEDSEYAHPDEHTPESVGGDPEDGGERQDPIFQVVQVQGNSNQTPKTEYQHKIKEFLDVLRGKGWKFERSSHWYAPHDDRGDYDEEYLENESDLDDWWDRYQQNHEAYKGVQEDAYGMPKEQASVSLRDLEELLNEIVDNNRGHYDGSIHIGDWEQKAQQIYHAFWMESGDSNKSKEYKDRLLKLAQDDIQRAEEKVYDNVSEWYFQNEQYFLSQEQEKYEELGGEWEEDQNEDEEEQRYSPWSGEAHDKTPLDEAKWEEAQEKVRDETYDEQLGDSGKFFSYLYMLFDRNGFVPRGELPNPSLTNGGLASYEDIQKMPSRDAEGKNLMELPGAFSSWRVATPQITIHPIDREHNVWLDEDGNQRARFRPGWAKNPETGKMEQTGDLEDTFLDKQGRQGQGVVAYHGDRPVGSLTWVDDPNGWKMLGTTYVHPDYRQQGIFNQMVQPLRESGQPIDAYVWNTKWLRDKVRSWGRMT